MNYKSLSYYALVNRESAIGVTRKIDNTIISANKIGVDSVGFFFNTNLKGVLSFFRSLCVCKTEVAIIRFSDLTFPVVFFIMIYLRLKGTKVIVDVPTPRVVGLQEIEVLIRNPIAKLLRKFLSYMSSSWILMPANLIIQYADEGFWFNFGLSKKTLKMGNGILVDEFKELRVSVWPSDKLRLISVANVSNWHGYDRVIRAVAKLNELNLAYDVYFDVVGEGDELAYLKQLVKELDVENKVFFHGKKVGENLGELLVKSHVGVSSLGLYRKGLEEASDLKTREYMLYGLPVIGVGLDPDFNLDCDFRYVVTNDNDIKSIVELIISFEGGEFSSPENIYSFAKLNLSLESKVIKILERLTLLTK